MANDPIAGVDNPPPALEGLTLESFTEEAKKAGVLREGEDGGSIERIQSDEEKAAAETARRTCGLIHEVYCRTIWPATRIRPASNITSAARRQWSKPR